MEQLILNTKIEIPPVRGDIIQRKRLLRLISDNSDQKVILVSAAAGFGKTTLLSQWAKQTSKQVVWFSIDENDDDVSCFFSYFIRALQQWKSTVGTTSLNLLQVPQPPQLESILVLLLNEIHKLNDDITIILDDYHLISSARINQLLNFLIDHLPQNMHLILSSRSDPNLPISRWLSQKQLIEIRASDLIFTHGESDALLNKTLNLELSSNDVSRLKSRTEGWITGLQLAALSLKGYEDKVSFINQFHGDNRYIIDYLLEEVFHQQPEEIQKFLLYTSLLNRLHGSLCDSITGRENSTGLLESIEKQNMFLFTVDAAKKWYRYHQLFKDVLNQRLQHLPGIDHKQKELHQKAGEWFADHGIHDDAIDHFLLAENYKRALAMMEITAELKWLCGQQVKLLTWFEKLPPEYIQNHPHLAVFYARELAMNGRDGEAEDILNQTEEHLVTLKDHTIDTTSGLKLTGEQIRGRILVIRSVMSSYRGNFTGVVLYAGEALELLNKDDLRWRNIAEITYALANSWAGFGNFSIACKAFQQAQHSSEKIKDVYLFIFCGICIAASEYLQGECYKAIETYHNLLEEAEKKGMIDSGIVGSAYAALGGIYCEMNEIEKGISFLQRGIQIAEQGHDALMLASTRLNQIRIHFYTNEINQVIKIVDEMEASPQSSFYPPWMKHVLSAIRPWIWMKTGHLKKAEEWAEQLDFPSADDISMRRETEYTVLARILIAQKNTEKAERLLNYLQNDAEKGNRLLKITELQILKAVNYYYKDEIKSALDELYHALSFAEPKGLFRIFAYEGETLAELLGVILDEKMATQKDPYPQVSKEYIKKLLKELKGEKHKFADLTLEEPLSDREQEVLMYIAAGLSNIQIADKLFVSLNTIRTHTKKINSKLGVHSRTQAVARAKELGLIE